MCRHEIPELQLSEFKCFVYWPILNGVGQVGEQIALLPVFSVVNDDANFSCLPAH